MLPLLALVDISVNAPIPHLSKTASPASEKRTKVVVEKGACHSVGPILKRKRGNCNCFVLFWWRSQ